jgi:hypothetical protein
MSSLLHKSLHPEEPESANVVTILHTCGHFVEYTGEMSSAVRQSLSEKKCPTCRDAHRPKRTLPPFK